MITTMSSSNSVLSKNSNKAQPALKRAQFGALYGFALKKSAGWSGIYSILLFLCYPLLTWKECYETAKMFPNNYEIHATILHNQFVNSFMVSLLLCGMVLVFSAVLYSYMHGKRSADFFHSMPVDRRIMLGANFAAGLTALILPIWVCGFLSAAAYGILLPRLNLAAIWGRIALESLAWAMGAVALFAVSTLVAVTVSTTVENIGYTVAVLLEGSILLLIWDLSCSGTFNTYLSIFSGGPITSIFSDLLYYLSPVFALAQTILCLISENWAVEFQWDRANTACWLPLLLWFVLGIAIFALALRIYHRRDSEKAEQWGRQSLIGFIVKLMSAVVGAFLFAVIFGQLLNLDQRYIYTFGALTGAPIVYLVIEAITNRGFHSMKKCLPYLGVAVGIILVGSLYFVADGFGFDKKIPEKEQIQKVELQISGDTESNRYNDHYAMNYEPNELNAQEDPVYYYGNDRETTYELSTEKSIDLVRELHRQSLVSTSSYLSQWTVSYQNGLSHINRILDLRSNSAKTWLELVYSEEYLEKYNPFFELKAEYLNMVQITDKVGNQLGEGEIPKEKWAALLSAIREDLANTDVNVLLDTEQNQEVAYLTFVTKSPKTIYESSGERYHYDMEQTFAVRPSESKTCEVLREVGFELTIPESYYETIVGIELEQAYSFYNFLPGQLPEISDREVLTKREYADDYQKQQVVDPEKIRVLIENMTCVANGSGDQYVVTVWQKSDLHSEYYGFTAYIRRSVLTTVLEDSTSYPVPYILNMEESSFLREKMQGDYDYAVVYWEEAQNMDSYISLKECCEKYAPEILKEKTQSELEWMEKTPYLSDDGTIIRIKY